MDYIENSDDLPHRRDTLQKPNDGSIAIKPSIATKMFSAVEYIGDVWEPLLLCLEQKCCRTGYAQCGETVVNANREVRTIDGGNSEDKSSHVSKWRDSNDMMITRALLR